MQRVLSVAAILTALSAAPATAAPGVDLAWNQCRAQSGATTFKASACLSTSGSQTLFASFNPPSGIQGLEACRVYVDYEEPGLGMSCWWNFSSGTTRGDALTVLPLPPTDVFGEPTVACGPNPFVRSDDGYYFLNHARPVKAGGFAISTGITTGQLQGYVILRAGAGGPVTADVQQYACGFSIANTGAGAGCYGCQDGVVFILRQITLIQPGLPDVDLINVNIGNMVTWNWNAHLPCSICTATQKQTWGAIKALYHD